MNRIKKCFDFKNLLQKNCLQVPGAFNGMVGRLVANQGFQGCYISGAAVTASYGVPDIGILTLDHFTNKIKEVSLASNLPIIADADTGFGEAEMCYRTVYEYFNAGASGLHIEDQVFPKRCGHLDGKTLISVEDMVNKIKYCSEASQEYTNGSFIICARTDAMSISGIEGTISRSKAFIDAGADMIFPEGLHTKEDFRIVADALRKHKKDILLLANMTEFGKTEYLNIKDFEELGYNCVIYPVSTLRIAMKSVDDLLTDLKKEGDVKNNLHKMQTRQELYNTLQYKPGVEWKFPTGSKK